MRAAAMGAILCAMAGTRLLMVKNDAVVARVVTVLLERWGYEVETVRGVAAALAAVGRKLPAVIVTDVGLLGLDDDGLHVARALKADPATREVPIIAIQAGDDTVEQGALAAGCDAFVGRPLDTHRLLKLLRFLAPASSGK
jgi:CheY-like chemotaxis protein